MPPREQDTEPASLRPGEKRLTGRVFIVIFVAAAVLMVLITWLTGLLYSHLRP